MKETKVILWHDKMRHMVPWVQKVDDGEYVLIFEKDEDWDYLKQREKITMMWYDYPKHRWEYRNRENTHEDKTSTVKFETPKQALKLYLEFGWGVELTDTNFTFSPNLHHGEYYCLLEPAKQWLELHQWDLKYRSEEYLA